MLSDVTQFLELFLKEFSQRGQANRLDILERGIEVMDWEDWPFHLYYTWLDQIEAAASLQVPVDAMELQPEVNRATSGPPSEVNPVTSELQPEACGEVSAVELPPAVNPATSELRPETYGEVSSAVEDVLLPCPAEEAVSLSSPAEEAVPLSSPAEEAILLRCPLLKYQIKTSLLCLLPVQVLFRNS